MSRERKREVKSNAECCVTSVTVKSKVIRDRRRCLRMLCSVQIDVDGG